MQPDRKISKGLYRPEYEHDACGIAMVVNIHGYKSHQIVDNALRVLENMEHRGAESRDKTGDGAGIMLQIPHEFILLQGIPVPEKGRYGTGIMFLPKDPRRQSEVRKIIEEEIAAAGLGLMPLRDVPVNAEAAGQTAREVMPDIKQIFVTCEDEQMTADIDLHLYRLRKNIEARVEDSDFYICSLSSTVIVYKGMLSSAQLRCFYRDLENAYFTSSLAIVHSRFSTNTFPNWKLAQPFRYLCHNGEINTIRGNREWIQARESVLGTKNILQEGMSDSASLDNVLEFLVMSGIPLPHAISILLPESFNEKNAISEDLRAFYEYYSILMEPWEGPAAVIFSDGRYAGGILDSNGLRPCRYTITRKGIMVVASEVGVMDFDNADIVEKGSLHAGKIMMVDTKEGRIYYDGQIKEQLASEHPYHKWIHTNCIQLDKIRSGRHVANSVPDFESKVKSFGILPSDIEKAIIPMCTTGHEPIGAMGNDTALSVLSDKPQHLFKYFRQQFAQVTNPAIDPLREELVMSLTEHIGSVGMGILTPDEDNCKMVRMTQPALSNRDLDVLCNLRYKGFRTEKIDTLFDISQGEAGLERALDEICRQAEESIDRGVNYVILSDRAMDDKHAAIPSLLALSAVHHHLKNVGKRVQTALIVESGEVWETMHMALLIGYGASAVNPYMAYAVIDDLVRSGRIQLDFEAAQQHYIEALKLGIKKIMSKMGIATICSYRGAKIFEALGLSADVMGKYFGTASSTIGGVGLREIAQDYIRMHDSGAEDNAREDHAWNPKTISLLQKSTREGSYEMFKEWSERVDSKEKPFFLRDLLDIKFADEPTPMSEVEPVESIVKHFVAGAMSFGALSKEAHETLALAMNKLGSRSNSGEGGEDNARFGASVDGISLSSKTKQIASGRFGVTTEYLVNAEEIQIKVAQGAKPGEGGQLPGFKVNDIIAKTRNSLPGITLISPPPHHDIYSIEDLAQLIYDLKNVNPTAAVSVKLVSESGVGTISAGVAKAKADLIVISGAEGGTGASPVSSTNYAGISPEIGLAEAQQTLVRNGFRQKVRLQVDGQLKTARDIVVMAMLGADEFAFGTLPMIVMGCCMDRKCNLNTCPVGIATQDPEKRAKFRGKVDHLVNYFTFLAEHTREYLSAVGVRSLKDIIGRTDFLRTKTMEGKCATVDLSKLLYSDNYDSRYWDRSSYQTTGKVLDEAIARDCAAAIESGRKVSLEYEIKNTNRAVMTELSGIIAGKYGSAGLPDGTVNIHFKGSAGQSFGAFAVKGLDICLSGEVNDYFGKGLSGAVISIMPPSDMPADFRAENNVIAGNTGLYGATSGQLYVNGRVGERFAVRNSGAVAVVEGVGDHCCEYMTGGSVVVLGRTGKNFGAGMSGGVAYIYDKDHSFDYFCNMELVEIRLLEETDSEGHLRSLIEAHHAHTGSALAGRILDDWENEKRNFLRVMPTEYRVAIEK